MLVHILVLLLFWYSIGCCLRILEHFPVIRVLVKPSTSGFTFISQVFLGVVWWAPYSGQWAHFQLSFPSLAHTPSNATDHITWDVRTWN